jgi:purine nucleosidase
MLAVKSGMLDVKAVTTSAGNSTVANTTRNARYIMRILGREDIPVYSGASKPLKRSLIRAKVHGPSGLAGIAPRNKALLNGEAVDRIISIVRKKCQEQKVSSYQQQW